VTQKGKGIFLGKPVGTPTGLFIGKPGLLIYKDSTQPVLKFLGGNLAFTPITVPVALRF